MDPSLYKGTSESPVANGSLPRFLSTTFDAAYPLGQVQFFDPDVPLHVRLEAFNPLVPGEVRTSGLPIALLRYVLRNDSDHPIKAAVAGSLRNFIGRVRGIKEDKPPERMAPKKAASRSTIRPTSTRRISSVFTARRWSKPVARNWRMCYKNAPASRG